MPRLYFPLLGLAVTAAIAFAEPALTQDSAAFSIEEVAAFVPTFPDRVVRGPAYNGQ